MNESESQPTRLNALLVQDEAVSSFNFMEFRMKLEASIRQLERRARAVRRATLLVLGVFLFCVLLGPLMQVLGFAEHQGLRFIWSGTGVIMMFTTGVLAAIYQYRYAPALTRAKSDLTSTTIAELQQQVADLSRKVEAQ